MSYKLSQHWLLVLKIRESSKNQKSQNLDLSYFNLYNIILDCAGGYTGAANAADRRSLVAVATEAAAAAHCV